MDDVRIAAAAHAVKVGKTRRSLLSSTGSKALPVPDGAEAAAAGTGSMTGSVTGSMTSGSVSSVVALSVLEPQSPNSSMSKLPALGSSALGAPSEPCRGLAVEVVELVGLLDAAEVMVRVTVVRHDANGGVGVVAQSFTPRQLSARPRWHSFRRLGLCTDSDTVQFEVVSSAGAGLGNKAVRAGELASSSAARMLRMDRSAGREGGLELVVRCVLEPPGEVVKRVFLLRHGESKWNRAVSTKDVKALISQRDHPLNQRGIAQAEVFRTRWMAEWDMLARRGAALAAAEAAAKAQAAKAGAAAAEAHTLAAQTAKRTGGPASAEARPCSSSAADSAAPASFRSRSFVALDAQDKSARNASQAELRSLLEKQQLSAAMACASPRRNAHDTAGDGDEEEVEPVSSSSQGPSLGSSAPATARRLSGQGGATLALPHAEREDSGSASSNSSLALPRGSARVGKVADQGEQQPAGGHGAGYGHGHGAGHAHAHAHAMLGDQQRAALAVSFCNAEEVLCSPLTRAIETAIIGLRGHGAAAGGIKLLSAVREVQNLFGKDSRGTAHGEGTLTRVREILERDMGREQAHAMLRDCPVDTYDTDYPWWINSKEGRTNVGNRIDDVLCAVRYSAATGLIVVGHSLFFGNLFNELPCEPGSAGRALYDQLRVSKLENCGCVAVDLSFVAQRVAVKDVFLLFESKLASKSDAADASGKTRSI